MMEVVIIDSQQAAVNSELKMVDILCQKGTLGNVLAALINVTFTCMRLKNRNVSPKFGIEGKCYFTY